jgi:hypothetical protein
MSPLLPIIIFWDGSLDKINIAFLLEIEPSKIHKIDEMAAQTGI